jgi:hypothetical protein
LSIDGCGIELNGGVGGKDAEKDEAEANGLRQWASIPIGGIQKDRRSHLSSHQSTGKVLLRGFGWNRLAGGVTYYGGMLVAMVRSRKIAMRSKVEDRISEIFVSDKHISDTHSILQ